MLSREGSRGSFDSPGGLDDSFRTSTDSPTGSSFATPGGGSAVSSPGFTGGKRMGVGSGSMGSGLGGGGVIGTPGSVKSTKDRALDRLLSDSDDDEDYSQSRRAFANAARVDSD
jgi:hypothetical protein